MTEQTLPITIKITNKRGLDPKVASEMAVIAARADCEEITLTWHERTVDVRSIVALISLGVESGDKVRLHATGPQAQQVVDDLIAIIQEEG